MRAMVPATEFGGNFTFATRTYQLGDVMDHFCFGLLLPVSIIQRTLYISFSALKMLNSDENKSQVCLWVSLPFNVFLTEQKQRHQRQEQRQGLGRR